MASLKTQGQTGAPAPAPAPAGMVSAVPDSNTLLAYKLLKDSCLRNCKIKTNDCVKTNCI